MAKPISQCKTVAELLEDPERWARGWFAYDLPQSELAKLTEDELELHRCFESQNGIVPQSFCLLGAMRHVGYTAEQIDQYDEVIKAVVKAKHPFFKDLWEAYNGNVAIFNDHPAITHEMLLEVVKELKI